MSETLPLWREGLLIPECRRDVVIPKRIGSVSTAAAVDLRNFFEKKFLKNFQKTFSWMFYSSSVGDSSSSAFGTVVNPAQV